MSFVTVTGRLLASHFQAGGEVPLTGQIFFTPTMEKVPTGEGVHLPAATSVELDGEGRFEIELLSAGFSWEVAFSLRHAGAFVPVDCFNFLPETGVDRVNFSDIVPITDPVTSQPMLRGEAGVGVDAITTEGGELIFTLTDGAETRIPVPQGIPGTGVDTITLQGDELVFALSDGSETRIPAPTGAPGDEGVGISAITLVDGELVFTLTDGSESRLPAPKGDPGAPGEPGDPGVSPPAPTLSVGNVETLPNGSTATAAITGDTPNYTLALGIPQGAPGAKGDKGDDGDTPTITAGTVSTLPAGAPATAAMVSTAGGYALNLGLPAGGSGAPGKDAATPTLAVGTVSTGTAAASITGTAPNFVLNLTLPAGSKGETGNPSAMTLVGVGRPDTPATLSTANQTAVANAPVGATFTSTDGAGTGAWAWVKTPTGWAVTYADTGWRDVTTWLVDPAGADKTSLPPSPVTGGVLLARRTAAGVELASTSPITFTTDVALQLPEGWWDSRASAVSIKWDATERKPLRSTTGFTRTLYHGGSGGWATRAGRYIVEGRWSMTAPWPATQPGTPA